MAKIYNNKKENKPVEIEQVEKIVNREEIEMSKESGVKIRQRYYDEKNKRWDKCEITGKISISEFGMFDINNGIVVVNDIAKANEIIEHTKETVLERDEATKKIKKVERKFWEIVA